MTHARLSLICGSAAILALLTVVGSASAAPPLASVTGTINGDRVKARRIAP